MTSDYSFHKQFVKCIHNFQFFEQIDSRVKNSIRTSEWFFRFDQCNTCIKQVSNKLVESIRSIIIADTNVIIRDLCSIIKKRFSTFDTINADSPIELIEQCKTDISTIDELFMTNFDIEKFHLATIKFAPQKMIDIIDGHNQIISKMDNSMKIEYNCILRDGVRSLYDLKQKYENKMSDLVKNLSNDIEYHLENYIQTIIPDDNNYSLPKLKSMLNQYRDLAKEIISIDDIQVLVYMILFIPHEGDFTKLVEKLNKLELLNTKGIQGDPIDVNKYIKQLITISEKIHIRYENSLTNASTELKDQVNAKIENVALQIKDFYNSTDLNQKIKLIDVCNHVPTKSSVNSFTEYITIIKNKLKSADLTIGVENLNEIIDILIIVQMM